MMIYISLVVQKKPEDLTDLCTCSLYVNSAFNRLVLLTGLNVVKTDTYKESRDFFLDIFKSFDLFVFFQESLHFTKEIVI